MSSRSRYGKSARISSALIPSATIATTVATGTRNPRIQGLPPIFPGSMVMRSNVTAPTVPAHTRSAALDVHSLATSARWSLELRLEPFTSGETRSVSHRAVVESDAVRHPTVDAARPAGLVRVQHLRCSHKRDVPTPRLVERDPSGAVVPNRGAARRTPHTPVALRSRYATRTWSAVLVESVSARTRAFKPATRTGISRQPSRGENLVRLQASPRPSTV